MAATKVRLQIAGSNFVISTTDSEDYLRALGERLDAHIRDVLEASPTASVTQASVIAALDYLDELEKSTSSVDNMRGQIRNYLEDASNAKLEAERLRREVEALKARLASLSNA